jgi:hypothetical protein
MQLEELYKRKKLYISYLLDRVTTSDWHGVQDAASDLREIEVEISYVEKYHNEKHCQSEKCRSAKKRDSSCPL